METPEECAKRLWMDCYPNQLDNGLIVKSYWARHFATKIAKAIIKETLDEYTNDENHDRVLFWRQVLIEIEKI